MREHQKVELKKIKDNTFRHFYEPKEPSRRHSEKGDLCFGGKSRKGGVNGFNVFA